RELALAVRTIRRLMTPTPRPRDPLNGTQARTHPLTRISGSYPVVIFPSSIGVDRVEIAKKTNGDTPAHAISCPSLHGRVLSASPQLHAARRARAAGALEPVLLHFGRCAQRTGRGWRSGRLVDQT